MSGGTNAVRRRSSKQILGGLSEPLLTDADEESPKGPAATVEGKVKETKITGAVAKPKMEKLLELRAWQENLVNLVAQWMVWFSLVLLKARQLELPPMMLSPEQEENLHKLQKRLTVPFDGSLEEHQEALRALWRAAYPDKKLTGMVSHQWKDMGWQGTDPSTDFRGGGYISLENLLHFAYRFPRSFRRLLNKEEGQRSEWEYPFAVAGLNITFMLVQLLDLRAVTPNTFAGRRFVRILGEDEKAFDNLYCVAFEMLDAQWLAMGASYMEFNAVLSAVRIQLEQALAQSTVRAVADLPAYQKLESS